MYQVEHDLDMTIQDKMAWLADNECNETGEAMAGIQTFLFYACDTTEAEEMREAASEIVLRTYDICKGEYDLEMGEEDDCSHRSQKVVDLIWSDLCGRKGFDLDVLDEEIQKDIKTSWQLLVENFA